MIKNAIKLLREACQFFASHFILAASAEILTAIGGGKLNTAVCEIHGRERERWRGVERGEGGGERMNEW